MALGQWGEIAWGGLPDTQYSGVILSAVARGPTPPPYVFKSTDGTLSGTIDGVNDTFIVSAWLRRVRVFRNGKLMTLNTDVVAGGQAIKFLTLQIPQPGDVIQVEGWI